MGLWQFEQFTVLFLSKSAKWVRVIEAFFYLTKIYISMRVCMVIMFHNQISPTIFSHWFQTANQKVLSLKIKDRNFNSNSFSGFLATKQDCFGFDCPFWHHFFPGMEMPVRKKPSSQPWSSVICVLSIMIRKFGMQSGCGLVKNLALKTTEIFFEVQLETPNINTSQHQFAIIHKLELNITRFYSINCTFQAYTCQLDV